MSVNSEHHVLGLWIGGGVTPAALKAVADAIEYHLEIRNGGPDQPQWHLPSKVAHELENIANACHAQLSKLAQPDPERYL